MSLQPQYRQPPAVRRLANSILDCLVHATVLASLVLTGVPILPYRARQSGLTGNNATMISSEKILRSAHYTHVYRSND